MNAPFPPLMTGHLVLRVLAGRSKGAEHRLPHAKFVRIGHAFDHDIVLRDASTKGLSLELHLGSDLATIRIVAGEAALLGRPVTAGEEASLPAFVPLAIGNFTVAIGEADSQRWCEVERLSAMIAPPASAATDEATSIAETPHASLPERITTRLSPWRDAIDSNRNWPMIGLAAGAALLLAIMGGPVFGWLNAKIVGTVDARGTLASAGFGTLKVIDAPGQPLVITGLVKDDAELARLRGLVAAEIGPANVDVDTMQGMAAAATDMLRALGIDADAKPMRNNSLVIATEFLPTDRQDEIARLIRNDLPGIKRVAFTTQNGRGDRDLQYFFSGSAFGLATFVDGAPGYIVTADGTRWFAGSQVPTGHKIIAIGNGRASFERDGRVEELVLGASPISGAAPAIPAMTSESMIGTKERTKL